MKIDGKRGRTVPCLLKPHIQECIHLIIKYRKEAKVADENEFLFALPTLVRNRIRIIDACNAIRKFSKECAAVDPKSLRGTTLRKQLASVCILKDLDDNTVSEVADFMGHEEKIHRQHYRRNPMVREIVKISKLLETAQGNCDETNGDDEIPENAETIITDSVKPSAGVSSTKSNRKRKYIIAGSQLEDDESEAVPKSKSYKYFGQFKWGK